MLIMMQDTPAIQLHPDDNVAIALMPLSANRQIKIGNYELQANSNIGAGHKIALSGIPNGEAVRRLGQVIGFASQPIAPGDHVHSQNLAVGDIHLNYDFGTDVRPVNEVEPRTFMGYRRRKGRAGTRNTIAVIGMVNCAAHTVRTITMRARDSLLPKFPNVTDIVGLSHKHGCGTREASSELDLLQRTLVGFARHPNVAGCLFVGLGCEVNQFESLLTSYGEQLDNGQMPPYLGIQDVGGIATTVEAGLKALEELLPQADQYQREPVPVSDLVVALQCGGSDGFSGVTANPALGHAVDLLVEQGGSAVLGETPEIYGAEHLLTRRAVSTAVGEKLIERIHWWENYTARAGFEIDNNPTPGNKAGGLTTIFEKSLGAVAKSGSTPLQAVYEYAQPITENGLSFMDTPGYDPISVTGQVAGGSNMIVFTTGRGSCFGFKPVPSIKVATNSATYQRMPADMDINAGRVLEGVPVAEIGQEIFDKIIAVASGEPSLSEAQGIGEEEFNPWVLGAVM